MKEFKPTFLYVKVHILSGLLYFGKTIKDPYKYQGSGKYWLRHIRHHGIQYVRTVWVKRFTNRDDIEKYAIRFSDMFNIVDSKYWANLMKEDGLNGGFAPEVYNVSDETRVRMSKARMGMQFTDNHRKNIGDAQRGVSKGPQSLEHRANSSKRKLGAKFSEEHSANIGKAKVGTKWWNNGSINKMSKDCPGVDWMPGRTKFKTKE